MKDQIWFLEGGWPNLTPVLADIDTYVNRWAEAAFDEGRKFQVSIEITEIS